MPGRNLLLIIGMAILGCSPKSSTVLRSADETDITDNRIAAVATVGMVADLVREVGGDHVTVQQLMGSGVDPHLYKATRDDVQMIMLADIVFYSGLMLEGKMTDTLIQVARDKPVIAVTEQLDTSNLLEPNESDSHYDPHVWMDVSAWLGCVDVVTDALIQYDSTHADTFRDNAESLKQRLEELHTYAVKSIETVPRDRRILVTSHDAFNYFGRAYGLEVLGVQGLSTESEAGLLRINQLVDLLVDREVQAVFVESSVSRKNIDSLIEGARAKGHQVSIGGELYSDAMGAAGTYEGSYIGMLDHNITMITRALGGQAPELGMQGALTGNQ